MKLFIIIVTLSFSNSYAQKFKLNFLTNFSLEQNGNISRFFYNWEVPFKTIVNYPIPHSSSIWLNSDIGLNYKTRWFKSGLNFYFLRGAQFQATVGMNALGFLNNKFIFLGPFIGFSRQIREADLDKKPFAKIGIESYLKNYHFAISYSRSFEKSTSNSDHLNGIMFQIGRSLTVFEQNQHPLFNLKNKVHFELNMGYGFCVFERLTHSPKYNLYFYEDFNKRLIHIQAGLSFRNKKYNFGLMYNHLDLLNDLTQNSSDFFNVKSGLNLISSEQVLYLGPYGLYGHSISTKPFNGALEFTEIGVESYFRNFHFTIGYQKYNNYINQTNKVDHMYSFNFNIGYAVPLGKRVKEN